MILNSEALNALIVRKNSTLAQVMEKLEECKIGICLVCDQGENKILGTITDGDIRRCLLAGGSLEVPAIKIAERNPIVCPVDLRLEQYYQISRMNSVLHLPLVDTQGHPVGLYVQYDRNRCSSTTKSVIMAGGKGTRLRPLTNKCPKPMLEVRGKPILERIVNKMRVEGLIDITICVNYLKEVIIDYFGAGESHGVNIEYIEEDMEMGTAGALGYLVSEKDDLLVTNGDVLTDVCYSEMINFHKIHKADATMAVKAYEWVNPYGVVDIDGIEIKGFREKPVYECHVNAGIYVIRSESLCDLNLNCRLDMPQLFENLKMIDRKTIVYPIHEPWIDVGRPDELEKARKS
jgi:dTDP-glucose pyrophosphorylase